MKYRKRKENRRRQITAAWHTKIKTIIKTDIMLIV
jgi:hypothetical protein